MHYISMISDRPDMVFQTEHMMRTVRRHSGGREISFTVIVNGNSFDPAPNPPVLTRRWFHNDYIRTHAEVYDCPQHWTMHVPCRWFVEPKADTCILIDTDIITCRDLSPLYLLDRQSVCGVPALRNPLSRERWAEIGMTDEDTKYYFNFGMIVAPSTRLREIGGTMLGKVPVFRKLFRECEYYVGQIALSHTLKELGVSRVALPREYNWLDSYPPPATFDEVLFMHYTLNREKSPDARAACSLSGGRYADVISASARHFYGRKIFA